MKKLQSIVIILLLLSAVAAAAGGAFLLSGSVKTAEKPQKTVADYMETGDYYYENSSYQQALSCYRKALEIEEDNIDIMRAEAKALKAVNYNEDAEEVYTEICKNDQSTEEDVVDLVNIKISLEEYEEAKEIATEYKGKDVNGQIAELLDNMEVEAPVFNLSSGTYDDYQLLKVEGDIGNSSVHYTTDGSEPTKDSDILTEDVVISAPENHIKAVAISYLGYFSDVVELDISITKAVEDVSITINNSGISSIKYNVFNIDWNDPVYNYQLAQIRELYCVGYNLSIDKDDEYSFYEDKYKRYNSYNSRQSQIRDLEFLKYMPFLNKLVIGYQSEFDISGIEYATNLKELSLLNDGISDISGIKNLTNLETLALGWNEIEDVSALSSITSLNSLGLWGNNISDISSLSSLTGLSYFDIADNQVKDISVVSKMSDLNELWVYDNNITDMSPVSSCTKLNKFIQSGNPASNSGVSDEVLSGLTETDWEAK